MPVPVPLPCSADQVLRIIGAGTRFTMRKFLGKELLNILKISLMTGLS